MNQTKINIKQADLVKIILAFLDSHNLHVSMRTLEKETGVVNSSYSEDVLFLRELILDGDWDEVLLFAQPFEKIKEFHSKKFKYLILKQKFLELLSSKSHVVKQTTSNSIEQVMETLQLLEENCPSKEEYSNLCWLLTVPNLSERNEFKEWSLDNSRRNCFLSVLEVIEKVIPTDNRIKRNANCSCKDRLLQLVVKGVLYEKCIEFCQLKAMGKETISCDTSMNASILPGTDDDFSANLLSWIKSLRNDVFNQPFEHILLEVVVENLSEYKINTRNSIDLHRKANIRSLKSDLVIRSAENFESKLVEQVLINQEKKANESVTLVNSNGFIELPPNHQQMFAKETCSSTSKEKNNICLPGMLLAKKPSISKDLKNADKNDPKDSFINDNEYEKEICKIEIGHSFDQKWEYNEMKNQEKLEIFNSVDKNTSTNTKTAISVDNTYENEQFPQGNMQSFHITNEKNYHDEKEIQRQLVQRKLGEYENRKKLMQQQLCKLNDMKTRNVIENYSVTGCHFDKPTVEGMGKDKGGLSESIWDGSKDLAGIQFQREEMLDKKDSLPNPIKCLSNNLSIITNHVDRINMNNDLGMVKSSTPKLGEDKIAEGLCPEASLHQAVQKNPLLFKETSDHEYSKTRTEEVKPKKKRKIKKASSISENESQEKENAPDGMLNSRKGPMINGVRRTLASSHHIFQEAAEVEASKEHHTWTDEENTPILLEADVAATAPKLQTQKVTKYDLVNACATKGPGPKIKTRDGSKVYVTELLKSREEIKNASANQSQDSRDNEEKILPSKTSELVESSNNEKFSFSPVCMLEDSQAIRAVCFHPGGNLFAVGANSKTLRLCTVKDFHVPNPDNRQPLPRPDIVLKRTKYHKGSIYCLAWNPAGELIATGSNDKSIKLLRFDPDNYVQDGIESELTLHNGTVRDLAFVPDKEGILISGGAGDGTVQVTDCAKQSTVGTLSGHSGNVMSVYAGYGDIVATGSTDNTLRLWDLRSLRCIDVILVGDSSPASVALNKDGSYLCSGQEDGFILLYDISAGRTLQSFRLHREDCRSVRFAPDSRTLLTGSYDTDISLLHTIGNLESTVPRHYKVAGHNDKVIQCRWHPKGEAFISSSADRTVVFWSSNSNRYS